MPYLLKTYYRWNLNKCCIYLKIMLFYNWLIYSIFFPKTHPTGPQYVWYSLQQQCHINSQQSVSDECTEYILAQSCLASHLGAVQCGFFFFFPSFFPTLLSLVLHQAAWEMTSSCLVELHKEIRRQDIWVLAPDLLPKSFMILENLHPVHWGFDSSSKMRDL